MNPNFIKNNVLDENKIFINKMSDVLNDNYLNNLNNKIYISNKILKVLQYYDKMYMKVFININDLHDICFTKLYDECLKYNYVCIPKIKLHNMVERHHYISIKMIHKKYLDENKQNKYFNAFVDNDFYIVHKLENKNIIKYFDNDNVQDYEENNLMVENIFSFIFLAYAFYLICIL